MHVSLRVSSNAKTKSEGDLHAAWRQLALFAVTPERAPPSHRRADAQVLDRWIGVRKHLRSKTLYRADRTTALSRPDRAQWAEPPRVLRADVVRRCGRLRFH